MGKVSFYNAFEEPGKVVKVQIPPAPDTEWESTPWEGDFPPKGKKIKIKVEGHNETYSIRFSKKPPEKAKAIDQILHCSGEPEVMLYREKNGKLLSILLAILKWIKGEDDNVSVGEDVPL